MTDQLIAAEQRWQRAILEWHRVGAPGRPTADLEAAATFVAGALHGCERLWPLIHPVQTAITDRQSHAVIAAVAAVLRAARSTSSHATAPGVTLTRGPHVDRSRGRSGRGRGRGRPGGIAR